MIAVTIKKGLPSSYYGVSPRVVLIFFPPLTSSYTVDRGRRTSQRKNNLTSILTLTRSSTFLDSSSNVTVQRRVFYT